MKKFFKALALVLALALVVGVVPAQTASAKAKSKQTLFVGNAQGTSKDGKLSSSYKEKVALYKLAGDKKSVKDDHEYEAKITSGKGVVSVSKKYVTAEKLGKAVVDIYRDDKLVGSTTITVKKNADADTLKLMLKDGDELVAVTAKTEFVAGVEYTFALPRSGKDTDERRFFVDDKQITDVEGAARTYAVKFDKAGEYTLVFEAFQSEKLDGATAEDKVTVTVKTPQPKELKQISANSFAVVFSHDMTGLIDPAKIKNDDIYYVIAGEKIVTGAIKSAALDKDDPTRVVITRYTNFIEGETYFFHYGDSEDLSFKAAVNKAENVDTVTVSVDGNCYVEEPKAILVKYFDKNGVELDIDATPIFVITPDELAYQSVTSNGAPAINFAAEGTATIKVTVTLGYDQETYAPIEKTASCEVKATKKSAEATSVVYSFGADPAKEVHFIRLNDSAAALKATFKGADGSTVSNYVSNTDTQGYYLKSTAEDIAQIASGNTVVGVNTGNAVILMCYKDSNDKEQVVKAFPIEVREANRGTTNVTATLDQSTINKAFPADTITLSVSVLDLNQKNYDEANLVYSLKQVDNNAKSVGIVLNTDAVLLTKGEGSVADDNVIEFTIAGTNLGEYAAAATGNSWATTGLARIAFELTVKENDTAQTVLAKKTLSFTVANIVTGTEPGVTVGYKVVTDKTALDASKKDFKHATTAVNTATVTVQKTATKNGNVFYFGNDTFTVIKSRNDIPVTVAASFTGGATTGSINYLIPTTPYNNVTVEANRTPITTSNSGDYYGFTGTHNISKTGVQSITVKNFESDVLDKAVAKTGNYTFTGVRVEYSTLIDNTDTTASLGVKQTGARKEIGTVSISVTANDAKATYTEKTGIKASTLAPLVGGDVSSLYKVTWDGIDSDITSGVNAGRIAVTLPSDAYKLDAETGAIYVYYIKAVINTFDSTTGTGHTGVGVKDMTLEQKITVNKLYKD